MNRCAVSTAFPSCFLSGTARTAVQRHISKAQRPCPLARAQHSLRATADDGGAPVLPERIQRGSRKRREEAETRRQRSHRLLPSPPPVSQSCLPLAGPSQKPADKRVCKTAAGWGKPRAIREGTGGGTSKHRVNTVHSLGCSAFNPYLSSNNSVLLPNTKPSCECLTQL